MRNFGQQQDALDTLETYWRRGGYAPDGLRRLADRLHEGRARRGGHAPCSTTSIMVTPLDEAVHRKLGDWMLAEEMAAARTARVPGAAGHESPTIWREPIIGSPPHI